MQFRRSMQCGTYVKGPFLTRGAEEDLADRRYQLLDQFPVAHVKIVSQLPDARVLSEAVKLCSYCLCISGGNVVVMLLQQEDASDNLACRGPIVSRKCGTRGNSSLLLTSNLNTFIL
jgi:hypothetical protein